MDHFLNAGFLPRIGIDKIFLSYVRNDPDCKITLPTVRPILHGITGNVPRSALGEIGYLTERKQNVEEGRVNFVCREYFAHQLHRDFQLGSSLV